MKIYIAKHYWKDGKNATWECHKKIDKELFKYLKNNYHNFVTDKPKMIKQGKYVVYLCYKEGTDSYGRSISEVTFFVLNREIEKDFCKMKVKDLKIILFDKREKILLLSSSFLLVAFLFIMRDTEVKIKEDNKTIANNNYTVLIKDWNNKLFASNEEEFLLDENNNTKMLLKLNKIMRTFNVTFDEHMSEDKIRKILKKATGKESLSDIVKKVLKK